MILYNMSKQEIAREEIIRHCLASKEIEPYELMLELMALPTVAMHGPEHHILLPVALLTALCNATGRTDLAPLLEEANKRSLQVPGGACGAWGICGAAIGAGIFSSIVLKSSPLAEKSWELSGQLTAKCADSISKQGGPRCCKRDCYTAILEAIVYCNEQFDVNFTLPNIICHFFANNKSCKMNECRFFPS
jgi:hypothetical protein